MHIDEKVLAKAKKWKTEAPIPDPEVRAHPHGGLQWSCPDCGNLHSQSKSFHINGSIQCARLGCRHKFRIGVGFTEYEGSPICLYMGDWKYNTANRLNATGYNTTFINCIGRLFGLLDWECPKCKSIHTSDVDFFLPSVGCVCGTQYFIQLLIYKPSGSTKIVPYDWALHTPKTHHTLLAPQTGKIQ